jgi:hypothetical protein
LGGLQFEASLGKKLMPLPNSWEWWYMHVIPATAESTNRKIAVQTGLDKKQDLIFKITRAKRAGNVAQGLSSKYETLSLNSRFVKKKKFLGLGV